MSFSISPVRRSRSLNLDSCQDASTSPLLSILHPLCDLQTIFALFMMLLHIFKVIVVFYCWKKISRMRRNCHFSIAFLTFCIEKMKTSGNKLKSLHHGLFVIASENAEKQNVMRFFLMRFVFIQNSARPVQYKTNILFLWWISLSSSCTRKMSNVVLKLRLIEQSK